ncbi:MAG TPA: malto-oligosyltrehalose trehalohydrolase [Nakamurella sp.]|nr:malto-oligosyltrehalose trehalohydrolase [Nakamurella sp.]
MTGTRNFTVWAPEAGSVTLVAGGDEIAMAPAGGGWWSARYLPGADPADGVPADMAGAGDRTAAAEPGDIDYGFRIDGGPVRPDPRSRRQPDGVHGLSRTDDPGAFAWSDSAWTGRQLAGSVIYELHVGTFTPGGTLDAAVDRLDHLVDLGVDLVELLPVNAFNGVHNWGYDGVLWYAVHEPYGGPAAYRRFVDACHARGLGVIQDVVYNHLGASGNYLPEFGPYLHQERANTWGAGVNLDGPDSDEVRRYIIDNALMWLSDYHVDGLRLDAVHALVDHRAVHLLEELVVEVQALSAHLGRPLSLIAESDLNDPRLYTPRAAGGYGLTAAWNDDFHHVLHVALTGETTGYYADFGSMAAIAKVLTAGYFHDGTHSSFRGRAHGRPIDTRTTEAWRLVGFAQDHDQIGNRAAGDRLTAQLDHRQLAIAAVLLLTAPFTPMLFMGEEWAAGTPWQFFTSHPEPDLGKRTAEGRIEEFARHGWDPGAVPDPQDPQTFTRSKLDWTEPQRPGHADILRLYRDLLALRRSHPELTDPRFERVHTAHDDAERWIAVDRGGIVTVANLSDTPRVLPLQRDRAGGKPRVLLCTGEQVDIAGDGMSVTVPPVTAAVLG